MRISDWSSDVCSSDLFALFMFFIGRRLLLPLGRIVEERGEMSDTMLSIILILFALCAFVMDAAGIHAVFGGFILGACMPRGKLTEEIKRKISPIPLLLVPIFFPSSEFGRTSCRKKRC